MRNQDVKVEREQHRRQARAFVPPEFELLQWDELQGEEKQGQRQNTERNRNHDGPLDPPAAFQHACPLLTQAPITNRQHL